MSFLHILQLTGFTTGAALHLFIVYLLWRRSKPSPAESVLLPLSLCLGAWHTFSLLLSMHDLLGLGLQYWSPFLRILDSVAVISITLTYSLLLHLHLHLWANASGRTLDWTEKVRVYLSYIPTLFLFVAIPRIWNGEYQPMLQKLSNLTAPFGLWAGYVLTLCAITDLLIAAKRSTSRSESRFMRTLAISFLLVGGLIVYTYGFGNEEGESGLLLQTLANLGSILPSLLLAYYIYRYRYLSLIVRESLIVATFAVAVLVLYFYGIRTLAAGLTARYSLREGAVESLLILGLVLLAVPLRGWIEGHIRKLFSRETSIYREILKKINLLKLNYRKLPEEIGSFEDFVRSSLGLLNFRVFVAPEYNGLADFTDVSKILEQSRGQSFSPVKIEGPGHILVYVLKREETVVGLMLISAESDHLTYELGETFEVLAGQLAVAIDECKLIEQNIELERRLAHGERLALLGRMAATIAHEVKNPLSAIKSIAQVMREDQRGRESVKDLDLIIGETDRLNSTVSQLLQFARNSDAYNFQTGPVNPVISTCIDLFRADASRESIVIKYSDSCHVELSGEILNVVRDLLLNLLTNAIQSTPHGGTILVETSSGSDRFRMDVIDSGSGVPVAIRERIWEPFFTTKQRGTGLGLAIARKRIEEVGGTIELAEQRDGEGARFSIIIPVGNQ
jgi:signal transduction histidine kinase